MAFRSLTSARRSWICISLLAPCAALTACGEDILPFNDLPDAAPLDSGKRDSGARDAGALDSGIQDSGGLQDSGTQATDSAASDAANVDSGFDAGAGDAGPGDASNPITTAGALVYFGDFAVKKATQLGRRSYPTLAASILPTGGTRVGTWDLSPTGKLVYSADSVLAGRFDLFAATVDGANIQSIATMTPATGEIKEVAISPDGTKVAYTANADAVGAIDVYVVSSAGANRVKLTPTRAVNPKPFVPSTTRPFAFSRDSKFLAFSGTFEAENQFAIYSADLSAALPVATAVVAPADLPVGLAANPAGVREGMAFTAAGKLLWKGRGDALGSRMYLSAPGASGRAAVSTAPDGVTATLTSWSVSPDGTQFAYAANTALAAATFKVYTAPSDGSGTARDLFAVGAYDPIGKSLRGASPIAYSPDGTKLAFSANYTSGGYEPHVVAAAGGKPLRVATIAGGMVGRDATFVAFAPDSQRLTFVAEHRVSTTFELFDVPTVTLADQMPNSVQNAVASGDFLWGALSDTVPVRWAR